MHANSLAFLLLAPALAAQGLYPPLEITEVLINPTAGGNQVIELQTGNTPVDTTGFHLVVAATPVPLPPQTVPTNTILVLNLGVAGTNTATQIYLPQAPTMGAADTIALFRSNQIASINDLIDFVGWGGAMSPIAASAVLVGRWSATSESAAVPALPGSTLANRRQTRSALNWVGPDAWYDDTTPTLGADNDPAMTWGSGVGCVTANAPGFGTWSQTDPGPWAGELTTLLIAPVPSVALLALSTTAIPPVALDPIGMPFCFAHITIESTLLLAGSNGIASFDYVVPNNTMFVGFEFYMQAFVPDATAGNTIQAQVTGALEALVGSR